MSRPFVAFLVLAALVFGGFVVMHELAAARDRQVLPPQRTRGPSRPNTDPPSPTPWNQAGIRMMPVNFGFGSSMEYGVEIKNHSSHPFTLAEPFATAVSDGREYATIDQPKDILYGTVAHTVAPGSSVSVQVHFPWMDGLRPIRFRMHGILAGRRLDWEIDWRGRTDTAFS